MATYKMTIAGLERELPICKVNDKLDIAGFVIFGDVEITVASAAELIKKCPDFCGILHFPRKANQTHAGIFRNGVDNRLCRQRVRNAFQPKSCNVAIIRHYKLCQQRLVDNGQVCDASGQMQNL